MSVRHLERPYLIDGKGNRTFQEQVCPNCRLDYKKNKETFMAKKIVKTFYDERPAR